MSDQDPGDLPKKFGLFPIFLAVAALVLVVGYFLISSPGTPS